MAIPRPRVFGYVLLICLSVSFGFVSPGIAGTSNPVPPEPPKWMASPSQRSVGLPVLRLLQAPIVPFRTPEWEGESAEPVTIEASEDLSFNELRRRMNRYPDQDILGRFAESATERPPLFGSNEDF